MATFEKRLMKLLKEAGWYKDRQGRTSHQQWRHPDSWGGLRMRSPYDAVPANAGDEMTSGGRGMASRQPSRTRTLPC